MTLITAPTVKATSQSLSLLRGDVRQRTFDGSAIVTAPPFALWQLNAPIAILDIGDARLWFAFLAQISKLENTFKVTPVDYDGPQSSYSGADPLIKGGSQLGTSINADGVTVSTLIAKAGDFLEVNDEFKVIISDSTSDGSGNVTFNFEPALRSAPSDNAVIDIQTPEIIMGLINPVAEWNVVLPRLYEIELNAIEVF